MSTIRTIWNSQTGAATFLTPRLRRSRPHAALDFLSVWHERSLQRRALRALEAHELADIGISRADALREADKPFWRP